MVSDDAVVVVVIGGISKFNNVVSLLNPRAFLLTLPVMRMPVKLGLDDGDRLEDNPLLPE